MRGHRYGTALAGAAGVMAVVAFTAAPANAAGGWHRVASPNQPGGTKVYSVFNGVAVTGPADAWAVGEWGPVGGSPCCHAFAEHWTGSSWTIAAPADVPAADDSRFDAVGGTGPGDVWAVGEIGKPDKSGTTLIEHWDGTAWTRSAVAPGEPPGGELTSVSADSPDDAWAAGETNPGGGVGYSPLIEHFNGTSWSVVTGVTTDVYLLFSVYAASPTDVWALGQYGVADHEPVIEHFNGHTWKLVKAPHESLRNDLIAISGLGPDDIWAVGGTASNRTLAEHWNGQSWSVVRTPNGPETSELTSVTALSAGDVWAIGGTGNAQEDNLIEHWNGSAWVLVKAPEPGTTSSLSAVSGLAGGPLFAVGTFVRNSTTYVHRTLVLEH